MKRKPRERSPRDDEARPRGAVDASAEGLFSRLLSMSASICATSWPCALYEMANLHIFDALLSPFLDTSWHWGLHYLAMLPEVRGDFLGDRRRRGAMRLRPGTAADEDAMAKGCRGDDQCATLPSMRPSPISFDDKRLPTTHDDDADVCSRCPPHPLKNAHAHQIRLAYTERAGHLLMPRHRAAAPVEDATIRRDMRCHANAL